MDDGRTGLETSEAALFAILWDTIADMLGTAATAAVVRRAAKRGSTEEPELVELIIVREELDYRYALPPAWAQNAEREPAALAVLARELGRLLMELTGMLVVRKLEQIPELRARGLAFRGETKGDPNDHP